MFAFNCGVCSLGSEAASPLSSEAESLYQTELRMQRGTKGLKRHVTRKIWLKFFNNRNLERVEFMEKEDGENRAL